MKEENVKKSSELFSQSLVRRPSMRRLRCFPVSYVILAVVLVTLSVHFKMYPSVLPKRYAKRFAPSSDSYVSMLHRHASPDKYILLALVDFPFADMAINFYLANLKPYKNDNFLFVAAGVKACQAVWEWDDSLPCYHYTDSNDSDSQSSYRTLAYNRKMSIRTDMILDALNAGFTVVHCDLDLYFFSNPLPEIKDIMLKADMAALWDHSAFNAGFIVVKSSPSTRLLYELIRNITQANPKLHDQNGLTRALGYVRRQNPSFAAVGLNKRRFVCGLTYFEQGRRMFWSAQTVCRDCVVVHNNWITSYNAKVFRFREHHMWPYDKDGYYSSPTQKYIVYNNTLIFNNSKESQLAEQGALKVALTLGEMLGRVVILPRFHAHRTVRGRTAIFDCPLNCFFGMVKFDLAFSGLYRESSFLDNPSVPTATKSDVSKPYFIVTTTTNDTAANTSVVVTPPSKELRYKDVVSLFGKVPNKVLAFQSLYGTVPQYEDPSLANRFEQKFLSALEYGRYRQY